jgi:hypothetical protein
MPDPSRARLLCHPWSRCDPVREIAVAVRRTASGVLAVSFQLVGDLRRTRLPPPRPPAIVEGLWRHTCFEVFIAMRGAAAYHEFNLAPSGQWAAFAFRSYRDGTLLRDPSLAPGIAVRRTDDQLLLDAQVALEPLSAAHARGRLRLGLSAVVEAVDGACSYWALCHPPGRPDFHHDAALALELEPPSAGS